MTDLLAEHRLDFHSTFRRLAYFRPTYVDLSAPAHAAEPGKDATIKLDEFIESLMALTPEPQMVDAHKAKADWKKWLGTYSERIESEKGLWDGDKDEDVWSQREKAMRGANPRFVLRQWVLEEVIKKVEEDAKSGRRVLAKVLQVCSLLRRPTFFKFIGAGVGFTHALCLLLLNLRSIVLRTDELTLNSLLCIAP